jgi:hypothetical protein
MVYDIMKHLSLNQQVETSSINRTHLSRPEDGRRTIFRNVVNFRFYIFILYILYFIHIKDDGQSPRNKWVTRTDV